METPKTHANMIHLVESFSALYKGRPTRLGVYERGNGVMNDYWIESGLPLNGVYLDCCDRLPVVRVDVGTLSREVPKVLKITIVLTVSGDEDGIDILDETGRTTVLRIEQVFPPT